MRSYPMCAFHASEYGHKVDGDLVEENRRTIKKALNNARMKKAAQLMEAIAEEEG